MGAAEVPVVGIVVGKDARARQWVGYAHGWGPVAHGDAVGPGERPEVGVERTVLLHDDDDVPDSMDARRIGNRFA